MPLLRFFNLRAVYVCLPKFHDSKVGKTTVVNRSKVMKWESNITRPAKWREICMTSNGIREISANSWLVFPFSQQKPVRNHSCCY